MKPGDAAVNDETAAVLARLHAAAFAGRARGWTAQEIASLAEAPGAALLIDGAPPRGFALLRVAADEAELLTIAVDPAHQGRGLGAALLARVEALAKAGGAAAMLLEVEADAAPARALYARAGWCGVGVRRDYLGPGRDSLILRKAI